MSTCGVMVAVIAALGGLMLCVRSLQARKFVGPEIGRKLVHVGMGLIALPFPWIFRDSYPVWLLAALAIALLGAVRLMPAVASRFGEVLGGVDRASLGEVFFPLGVAIAFTLAHGDAAAFCAAVGVLAFADTAGALVGTRWGRLRYSFFGHKKSIEGSTAVFVVSVACVAIASTTLGAKTRNAGLASGLLVGLVAAVVEAISSYGLDNLLLPAVVVELLKHNAVHRS
jgi:phytol kinase